MDRWVITVVLGEEYVELRLLEVGSSPAEFKPQVEMLLRKINPSLRITNVERLGREPQ